MFLSDLNLYAIVGAALVQILIGMIWYSPQCLGTIWAQNHQFDMTLLKPSSLHYLGGILVALITAVVLSFLIHWFKIVAISQGIKLAFLIWLGFIATSQFSGVIWARKPIIAYLIDVVYFLVSLTLMSIIVTYWQ